MAGAARFFGGAAIMAAAVGVTKVLGALYKIPLGNALGAEGMAHFYAAYNVYNVLLLLSTAGLPAAVCRLTSQSRAKQQYRTAWRVYTAALVLFTALGIVSGAVMFCFPQALSALLHDEAAAPLIRVLAPGVVCVCVGSAVRGYTQGLGRMAPTAMSQMIESATKLLLGLALCLLLIRQNYGTQAGAAGAMAGVTAGSLLSLLYLLGVQRRSALPLGTDTPPSYRQVMASLVAIGLPATLGSVGMSLLTLLDQSLTLHALHGLGYSDTAAIALYGTYTFALTLFALPGSFTTPLSASLLPALSGAAAKGDKQGVMRLTKSALRLTALLSFPMGVGLSVLAGPILSFLYPAVPDIAAAAAEHLAVLGIAAIFVCFCTISTAVLLSLGREKLSLLTLFVGGAVKIGANLLLSAQPHINIHGAPWSTLLCYGVIAALNLWAVQRATGIVSVGSLLWPAALSSLVMALAARPGYIALAGRLLPTIAVCAALYFALCFALGAIDLRELTFLKQGESHHDHISHQGQIHL